MLKRNTAPRQYDELTRKEIIELAEQYHEMSEYMRSCLRVLCYLIKDFSFDLDEVQAEDFKQRMDDLVNQISTAESPKAMRKAFDSGKESIIAFITKEKQYLTERESELKGIIDLLKNNIQGLVGQSQTFNTELYEQNMRMGRLAQLDDIRRLKESLQAELAKMQKTIQDKQSNDTKRLEVLMREVEVLRSSIQDYKGAAMTDPLTKAANRLAFDTHIRSCVEQGEMHHQRFALLVCDIDDFREFNTRFGHQIGDIVLQLFVAKCKSILRNVDMVARYGGDEFAIVLPRVNLKQAQRIASRICEAVAGNRYVHNTTSGKLEFNFSVSIGVSEMHRFDTVQAVIDRADKSLYAAKKEGKGCTRNEKQLPVAA